MNAKDFLVDIHTHSTFRAYNSTVSNGYRNVWEKTYNPTFDSLLGRWIRMQTREVANSSQANLYNYAEGNVKILFDSLYPMEKGFLKFRKVPSAMVGRRNEDELLKSATGIDHHQLQALRKNNNYFQELLGQYAFLSKGQGKSPDGKHSYKVVGSWSEIEALRREDPDAIAVVVTIEGAHSLNCGLPKKNGYVGASKRELLQNVGTVKSWKAPPFFINLAHHFYNELCGHTRSLKPGVFQAFNQKKGLNEGINGLGWKVVHELLAQDNGRRVLIDVKHMSVKARREYYKMLESHNRLRPDDLIPIICSHTGVNEFKTMKASGKKKDKGRKMKRSQFHNWAINLSDEEIRIIGKSDGIIGIMVDKGLLGSKMRLQQIRDIEAEEHFRDAYLELIAQNVFQVVRAIGKRDGWDVLALGTDFDGMITHLDLYPEASKLPDLRRDLVSFLERRQYGKEFWFGYQPEEIIRKVMQTNALKFMEKYF